jgi:hypothetical protein
LLTMLAAPGRAQSRGSTDQSSGTICMRSHSVTVGDQAS